MRLRLAVVAFAACIVAPALAQPSPPSTRIPTVTRLVKLFTELEMDVVARAQANNASALDAILDPSFEMRSGSAPGTPVPRDTWIREARAAPRTAAPVEQMAVHDFGDIAIVSFREAAAGAPTRRANRRFVVDCWKRDGARWKLSVRYVSDTSAQSPRPAPSPGTIDKRY